VPSVDRSSSLDSGEGFDGGGGMSGGGGADGSWLDVVSTCVVMKEKP